MALEKQFDLIFRTAEGFMTLLPRTVAEQVLLVDGHTVADHISSDKHLYPSERTALNNKNQPGGFVVLDAEGHVPLEFIDSSYIAIKIEFDDIQDMLTNGGTVKEGALVMVFDTSDDPSTRTNSWGIYRRKMDNPNYWELSGWDCITAGETLDIKMDWDSLPGVPSSTAGQIDDMVAHAHAHTDLLLLEKFSETIDGHLAYDGAPLAFDSEVTRFYTDDYLNPHMRIGDFWLKQSYGQQWWHDPTIPDAGTSCYEKYRDYDTMVTSPKLRTQNTTIMTRMFYRCYSLTEVQQYNTDNVTDFTGMFAECNSLEEVPCMKTKSGNTFDQMFYLCQNLNYSPEIVLDSATSTIGMYSGCTNLEYVLPFGSTANVVSMKEMFNGCESLKKIYTPIDFTSASDASGMFNGCIDLEEIEFKPGTLKVNLSLANTNLTADCIVNILDGLPEVTNSPTLTLLNIPSMEDVPVTSISDAENKGWIIYREENNPEPGTQEDEFNDD